jgi:hypothetical protein
LGVITALSGNSIFINNAHDEKNYRVSEQIKAKADLQKPYQDPEYVMTPAQYSKAMPSDMVKPPAQVLNVALCLSGVEVLKNKTTTKDDFKGFDVVVIATYAKLNELLDEKKWYQYELCEKPVVRLPKKYQGKSIVIMDGPFMCLDPYGDRNHVLGNVKHAIHTWNEGTEPLCIFMFPKWFSSLVPSMDCVFHVTQHVISISIRV